MKPDSIYYDQGRIQTLQFILCSRLDDLFDKLGLSLHKTNKLYVGACPIHGGDNPSGLNLYHSGDLPGKWRCNTHHCEAFFKKTIVGFVRGILSHQKYDWMNPDSNRSASFKEAVDWCCNFIGQKLWAIKVDDEELEKRAFASTVSVVTRAPAVPVSSVTRAHVRDRLHIPAEYFKLRGWSAEVLDRYDAGLCKDPTKPFYNRVVVPIYDNNYTCCVGFTARSIYPQCNGCKLWHDQETFCNKYPPQACSKWRNSDGFARESHLYNFWFAQRTIKTTGVVLLCEGPGDVWRLEESGFGQGVGMLGTSLSDQQQCILEASGAISVVILTNSDEPGNEAAEALTKQLHRLYRIFRPELPKKDLGEMQPSAVKELLSPLLEKARR